MSNVLTDKERQDIWSAISQSGSSGNIANEYAIAIERALLAKAGEQEPVAVMHNNGMTSAKHEFSDIDAFLRSCRNNTPLYDHPAPQQAIPEGWKLVPIEPTTEMLNEMCLIENFSDIAITARYKAMLSVSPEA